jgi:hypothetical protein
MLQWTSNYRAVSFIPLNKTERLPRIRNGKLVQAILIFLTLTFGGVGMAQAQVSLEDLQKRKTIAEAEKAAIEAETALDAARKKQSELATPIDPAKKAKDDAVEAANSAKAIAEAKKAQSDAEVAAFKAQFGEIPDSGIKGSVELGDKAGSMETALLATRALASASDKIAEAVKASLNQSTAVLIFPSGEVPDLKALSGFRALKPTLLNQLTSALIASEKAKTPEVEVPVIPAIGVALSTMTKLLSFFASDFKVGGIDLTPDSILLAEAVGGKLRSGSSQGPEVFLKYIFNPIILTAHARFFVAELQPLSEQYEKVLDAIRAREGNISNLTGKLAKITGDTQDDRTAKIKLTEGMKPHQDAVEKLKRTAQAYETFMSKLTGSDGGLDQLIRQFEMEEFLNKENSYLLVVKTHKAGGSHYVEKNLWTSFGKMPFKVMGGVIASYSLFKGKSGSLVMSGIVPVHGGFHSVKDLADLTQ